MLFPNPASKSVYLNTGSLDVKFLSILDLTGKKISSVQLDSREIQLNIEKLNSGTYLLQLELMNGLLFTKSLVVL